MLLNTIAKKYPNNYVILSPNKRNSDGAVSDWKVLNATKNYSQAKNLADYYRAEGLKSAVIISTAEVGSQCYSKEL